jgi:hypothetical protein
VLKIDGALSVLEGLVLPQPSPPPTSSPDPLVG